MLKPIKEFQLEQYDLARRQGCIINLSGGKRYFRHSFYPEKPMWIEGRIWTSLWGDRFRAIRVNEEKKWETLDL